MAGQFSLNCADNDAAGTAVDEEDAAVRARLDAVRTSGGMITWPPRR